MKTKDSTNGSLAGGAGLPEDRSAGGVPRSATAGLAARNPDADIPPLPSVFDLVKRKLNLQVEANAPEWAKRAAQLAFASLTPQRRKRAASEAYHIGFDSGYCSGASKLLASAAASSGEAILKQHWAGLASDRAADFFCGFRDGEKLMRSVPGRAQQMAQRTKIFQTIAARWKETAPGVLQDTGRLHQWLLAQNIISARTDSAEIRLVCAKIGLRYKRPGKPRKLKM